MNASEQKRRPINRLLRATIDPPIDWIYWRLDLNDRGGHPNHSKILSTVAFIFGLIGLAMFGLTTVRLCGAVERMLLLAIKGTVPVDPAAIGQLVRACALSTAALLAYAALVFGMPFGLSGFKVWASTKGGGTTETLGQAAQAVSFDAAAAAALAAASPEGRERADGV